MLVPYHKIQPDYDYHQYKDYTVLERYCTNPICTCEKVELFFVKYENEQYHDYFSFNFYFNKNRYDEIKVYDILVQPEGLIESFLSSTNYIKEYKSNYINAKIAGLNKQEIKEVELDKMNAYSEFYTQDEPLSIKIKQTNYYLYDLYCMDPNCDCNHVILHFIEINKDSLQYKVKLSINYPFYEDECTILNKACSKKQALEIIDLIDINEDLYQTLINRYDDMKDKGIEILDANDEIEYDSFYNDDELNFDDYDFDEDEYEEDMIKELYNTKFKSSDFKTLLSQLSLKELKNSYGAITGESPSLNKKELIEFFYHNYQKYLLYILTNFHTDILEHVFDLVSYDGLIPADEIPASLGLLMKISLLAFPVTMNNHYVLIMSQEVLELFKDINENEIFNQVKENDIIIQYTRILTEIYGEFESSLLFKYLNEYENIKTNYDEKVFLLNSDSLYTDEYDIKNGIIFSYNILELNNFHEMKENNKHLDYYKIPKPQFYEEDGYTEEQEKLFDYLYENNTPENQIYDFIELTTKMIKLEVDLDYILVLLEPLEIIRYEKKILSGLVTDLYHHTRLYSLKGHTRYEVKNMDKLVPFNKLKK